MQSTSGGRAEKNGSRSRSAGCSAPVSARVLAPDGSQIGCRSCSRRASRFPCGGAGGLSGSHKPSHGPVGVLVAKPLGQRAYVLVYDLYPDLAEALGAVRRGGILSRSFDFVNRLAFRRATGLIAVGTDMARRNQQKLGSGVDVQVLPNWADGGLIAPGSNEGSQSRGHTGSSAGSSFSMRETWAVFRISRR